MAEPVDAPARGPGRLRSPFVQLSLAALVLVVAIAAGSFFASRRAGETQAMAEARNLTEIVARTVVEPNLTSDLLVSDPDTIAALDAVVHQYVLTGTTVRVKLWDENGVIVYSDEPRLIGEQYALEDDQLESIRMSSVVSEISSLEGPENRFEVDQGQLLEVYLPLWGPSGETLLYESYFEMGAVNEASSRIRSEFAPIVIGSLALMFLVHLGLAWTLNRRLRRDQREREQLLHRAMDASHDERRRIAADLHDGVVQDLVATSFAVSAAAETASSSDTTPPELAVELRSAAVGTRRSLQSLRSLLVDIYPPNLRTQGLSAALDDLLAPISSLGIDSKLQVEYDVPLDETRTELIYRVAREATRNVLRHANASQIDIRVTDGPDSTVAVITDDGDGFRASDAAANGHLGLRVMSDLAAEAAAHLTIESEPGTGTTVCLEVPR